jgi:hypothetical protein
MFAQDDPYQGTLGQRGQHPHPGGTRGLARTFIDTAPLSTEDKLKLAHLNAERLLQVDISQ